MSRVIARRLVDSVTGASGMAAHALGRGRAAWTGPIDFLFIDGDHDYEAVRRDFEEWSPHVTSDGTLAFHDALTDAAWMDESFGSARFVAS